MIEWSVAPSWLTGSRPMSASRYPCMLSCVAGQVASDQVARVCQAVRKARARRSSAASRGVSIAPQPEDDETCLRIGVIAPGDAIDERHAGRAALARPRRSGGPAHSCAASAGRLLGHRAGWRLTDVAIAPTSQPSTCSGGSSGTASACRARSDLQRLAHGDHRDAQRAAGLRLELLGAAYRRRRRVEVAVGQLRQPSRARRRRRSGVRPPSRRGRAHRRSASRARCHAASPRGSRRAKRSVDAVPVQAASAEHADATRRSASRLEKRTSRSMPSG